MLVDLRYHIITIVIIFVTLAIGILIGSSMVANGLIVEEQKHLISKVEDEFKLLRIKNKEFSKEVSYLESKLADNLKFQKMIMPLVVKEQLKKESLLVLLGNNANNELVEKLVRTLKLANVNNLEVTQNIASIEEGNDFTKILLLGQLDAQDSYLANLKDKIIKINSEELSNIPGLIKLVFELAAKELPSVKGEEFWIN